MVASVPLRLRLIVSETFPSSRTTRENLPLCLPSESLAARLRSTLSWKLLVPSRALNPGRVLFSSNFPPSGPLLTLSVLICQLSKPPLESSVPLLLPLLGKLTSLLLKTQSSKSPSQHLRPESISCLLLAMPMLSPAAVYLLTIPGRALFSSLRLQLPGSPSVFVAAVYHPPHVAFTSSVDFRVQLSSGMDKYTHKVILCDFNADPLSSSFDATCIRTLVRDLSLKSVDHGVTHVTSTSDTWLDLCMVDESDTVVTWGKNCAS